MMATCSVCGKPCGIGCDKCFDCAKEELRKILNDNQELKEAFRASIEEMQKPENVKRAATDTAGFFKNFFEMVKGAKKG